jgi:hypothetical protein
VWGVGEREGSSAPRRQREREATTPLRGGEGGTRSVLWGVRFLIGV